MKCNVIKVVMRLLFIAVLSLTGCGGGGGSAAPPAHSLITSVGWYFDNIPPDLAKNAETCVLNVIVYYSDSVASGDIESFSMTSPNGGVWTIPAQNFQTGTSSSGKPYIRAGLYYSTNSNAFPLAGGWTAKINLKNGQTSSQPITLHEPGSSANATHQYLYTQENWAPSTDQSQYVAALARFPSQGYSVLYSAANGGSITTTGLAAVRASFLATEPRAYNVFCWLYDANKVYLGNTTRAYSTHDHSPTNLITADGELSITPATTTSSTGEVDLSLVKYIRFIYVDGAQYAPSSYSSLDNRSISTLVAVEDMSVFRAGVRYPVPASMALFWGGDTAMGDLNGDGRNDIVVMEAYGSRILVYYQNVAGTFDAPQVINTSLLLKGIAIKDINNDGLADLVVSGNSATPLGGWLGRMGVFRQNPATHALNAAQEYGLSTNTAGALAIADLNSDGLPDIVIASAGNSGNGLLSFFFQGAGGTLGTEYAYTAVPVAGEIHVADMNSDGLNDIVVQSGLKQLAVIKQLSPGAYSTAPDFYTVQTSYWGYFKSLALGDLNGDGRTDIAVADPGNSGYLNIFFQNTTGTLTGPTLINFTGNTQDELRIADVDDDGLNDILVLSCGYQVMVLRQSPAHTFQNYQNYFLPTLSEGGTVIHQAMTVGDVTGDGLPDVVASWSDEGIFVLPRR